MPLFVKPVAAVELRRDAGDGCGRPPGGGRCRRAVRRPGAGGARSCAVARSTWGSSSFPTASSSPARRCEIQARSGRAVLHDVRQVRGSRDPVPRARARRRQPGGDLEAAALRRSCPRVAGLARVDGSLTPRSAGVNEVNTCRASPSGPSSRGSGRGRTLLPGRWCGPCSIPRSPGARAHRMSGAGPVLWRTPMTPPSRSTSRANRSYASSMPRLTAPGGVPWPPWARRSACPDGPRPRSRGLARRLHAAAALLADGVRLHVVEGYRPASSSGPSSTPIVASSPLTTRG